MIIAFIGVRRPFPMYDGFHLRFFFTVDGEENEDRFFDVAVGHADFFGWDEYTTDLQRQEWSRILFGGLVTYLENRWGNTRTFPANGFLLDRANGLQIDRNLNQMRLDEVGLNFL
jgi:hypothetical protein